MLFGVAPRFHSGSEESYKADGKGSLGDAEMLNFTLRFSKGNMLRRLVA